MWSALGIHRRHKRGQSERDQKGQALVRKHPPPPAPHSLLANSKNLPNLNEARAAQEGGEEWEDGHQGVAFEWSNKHKRRQKCHFSPALDERVLRVDLGEGSLFISLSLCLSVLGNDLKCFFGLVA